MIPRQGCWVNRNFKVQEGIRSVLMRSVCSAADRLKQNYPKAEIYFLHKINFSLFYFQIDKKKVLKTNRENLKIFNYMYTIILKNLMISDVHCQGNDRKPNELYFLSIFCMLHSQPFIFHFLCVLLQSNLQCLTSVFTCTVMNC